MYNIVFNKDGKIRFKMSPAEICPALFPIEHLYMTVDIFDIQLLNTMCHQHIFLSFRFALREPDSIYKSKKRTSTFWIFSNPFLLFIALIGLIHYFMNLPLLRTII